MPLKTLRGFFVPYACWVFFFCTRPNAVDSVPRASLAERVATPSNKVLWCAVLRFLWAATAR